MRKKESQTDGRVAAIQQMCESYLSYKEKVKKLSTRILDYEKMKSETDEKDWHIIEEYEARDKKERSNLMKKILLFDRALDRMNGRTALVFKQLYVEKVLWDAVEDQNGKRLSPSSIALERDKGLKILVDFCDWSKME